MAQVRWVANIISASENKNEEEVIALAEKLYHNFKNYYSKDYENHRKVDKEIFVKTMAIFYNDFAKANYFWLRDIVENSKQKTAEQFFAKIYETSFLSNPQQAEKLLKKI